MNWMKKSSLKVLESVSILVLDPSVDADIYPQQTFSVGNA